MSDEVVSESQYVARRMARLCREVADRLDEVDRAAAVMPEAHVVEALTFVGAVVAEGTEARRVLAVEAVTRHNVTAYSAAKAGQVTPRAVSLWVAKAVGRGKGAGEGGGGPLDGGGVVPPGVTGG